MRSKKDDPIEIALCFDSNYEFYAAVSIYSVLISSRYPVRFWLVTPPDFVKTLGVFDDLSARFAVDINFIKISNNPFAVWKTGAHFSSANYLRLLLPDILAIDKVIYIDSDVLVIDCLNELWHLDLGDRSIGAVAGC